MSDSPLLDWLLSQGNNLLIGIIRAIATLIWWLEKAAA